MTREKKSVFLVTSLSKCSIKQKPQYTKQQSSCHEYVLDEWFAQHCFDLSCCWLVMWCWCAAAQSWPDYTTTDFSPAVKLVKDALLLFWSVQPCEAFPALFLQLTPDLLEGSCKWWPFRSFSRVSSTARSKQVLLYLSRNQLSKPARKRMQVD